MTDNDEPRCAGCVDLERAQERVRELEGRLDVSFGVIRDCAGAYAVLMTAVLGDAYDPELDLEQCEEAIGRIAELMEENELLQAVYEEAMELEHECWATEDGDPPTYADCVREGGCVAGLGCGIVQALRACEGRPQ